MKSSLSFLFLLSCLIPQIGNTQITFDANPVATNSDGVIIANTATFTVPLGIDRLLVVVVGTDDLVNTPTITYNSSSLAIAGEGTDNFNSIYDARVLVYYLTLGTGGAINDEISVSGLDDYFIIGGMSFQKIKQTGTVIQTAQAITPTGTENTSQVAAILNNVAIGNLIFGFFGEDNVKQFDWGGTYTAGSNHTDSGLTGDGYYFASYDISATQGNSHTFTYDINNGTQTCAGVLVEFARELYPEINIQGNGMSIAHGDTNPMTSTHTDFENAQVDGGLVNRTFTIQNIGEASLTFANNPIIGFSPSTTEFVINTQPLSNTISASATSTFTVDFNPTSAGTKTATIHISNNDLDENPYTFQIRGNGIFPIINISLNASTVTETTSTHLDYTFTLSETVGTDLPINFSISGTAEDDNDFTVGTLGANMESVNYTPLVGAGNNSGSITIKSGETIGVLRITPSDDSIIEADESVTIKILTP